MFIQQSEETYPQKDIVHLLVKHGLLMAEIEVYPENTMRQIFIKNTDDLQMDSSTHRAIFKNERTGKVSSDQKSTVRELDLKDGDTLLIDDGTFSDATIVSQFGIVNNTLYRMRKDTQNERDHYHELLIASSNNSYGHEIKFYVNDSSLHDIIAPYLWMPKWVGCENIFTEGKRVLLIVNEITGACAMPSEFNTLITEFVGNVKEPGRLFVILEDEKISGMHLESFSFSE